MNSGSYPRIELRDARPFATVVGKVALASCRRTIGFESKDRV